MEINQRIDQPLSLKWFENIGTHSRISHRYVPADLVKSWKLVVDLKIPRGQDTVRTFHRS